MGHSKQAQIKKSDNQKLTFKKINISWVKAHIANLSKACENLFNTALVFVYIHNILPKFS